MENKYLGFLGFMGFRGLTGLVNHDWMETIWIV